MTTSEKISNLRKQKNLSQEELAEKINVSRQAISKWEAGMSNPSQENLFQLAEVFEISAANLLDDKFNVENTIINHNEPKHTKKSFKKYIPTTIITILILIMIIAIGVFTVEFKKLKKNLIDLENRISNLQGQITYLQSNNTIVNENEDWTDFDITIGEYDKESELVDISIWVVPKNYNKNTIASIAIKGKSNDYIQPAVLENGAFKADFKVKPGEVLSIYLYLEKDGETKSVYISYISDLENAYLMSANSEVTYSGNVKGSNFILTGEMRTSITPGKSMPVYEGLPPYVYPVKGIVEVEIDGVVVDTVLIEGINTNDFISVNAVNEDIPIASEVTEITYFTPFEINIPITKADYHPKVSFIVTITDNFSQEYTQTIL